MRRPTILTALTVIAATAGGVAYGVLSQRLDVFPASLLSDPLAERRAEAAKDWPAGRWREAREALGGGTEGQEQPDMALTVPYLTGSKDAPVRAHVVRHDRARACPGVNLYVSAHAPQALLIDMDGRLLHSWSFAPEEIWPQLTSEPDYKLWRYWRRAHVFENGDLLAVFEGAGIVRLDKDSRLLWHHKGGQHHDLDVDGEGNIHVLGRRLRLLPRIDPERKVLEDDVTTFAPDGTVVRRFSLLECFENSRYAPLLEWIGRDGDTFHTNTIQVLDGSLVGRSPVYAEGNLLISVLHLNTVAIVDPRKETVVWALTGGWQAQHEPVLLPSGRMLLFDNNLGADFSRVIEFDPLTQQVVWEYRGTEESPFRSRTCGSAQRLPNGNTLITESDFGRAFEVTPGKEIVWEYLNPHRAGKDMEWIATLFDMVRLPPDFPVGTFTDAARSEGKGGGLK